MTVSCRKPKAVAPLFCIFNGPSNGFLPFFSIKKNMTASIFSAASFMLRTKYCSFFWIILMRRKIFDQNSKYAKNYNSSTARRKCIDLLFVTALSMGVLQARPTDEYFFLRCKETAFVAYFSRPSCDGLCFQASSTYFFQLNSQGNEQKKVKQFFNC